jgi:hypothetical protein
VPDERKGNGSCLSEPGLLAMPAKGLIKGVTKNTRGFGMRTGRLARILGSAALVTGMATAGSAVVMFGAGAAVAGTGGGGGGGSPYNCTGGNVPPGTYRSVTISGVCTMSNGNVVVKGNLTVKPGALLDNGAPGDPTTAPTVAAQLYVGGNVWVGKGAVLILGCSPNSSCGGNSTGTPPTGPGISSATIRGSVTAIGAQGVVVHSSSIGGNFTDIGGGGGAAAQSCAAQDPSQPTNTALEPWSLDPALDFTPVFTDFEDSTIGGSYTIASVSSCWLGSLRNEIRGDATFVGNQMGDPDAMEIGNNLINHDLICFKNNPAPQFGDGASSDLVGGRAKGQCSFSVVLPNPAAEAIEGNGETGVGVQQHFAVSTRHLRTYFGTHTQTPVTSLPTVTTDAGNTISADIYNIAFAGNGLVGTGTFPADGTPGQSPGEAVLSTTFPNGTTTFTAYDTCDMCSFAGQTGSVSLRAYGTVNRHGFIQGTFLITSNGTILPTATSPVPGLATMVGYGYFWGSGSTVHLIEHLGFG